jgi:hypothetical protein
MNSSHCTRSFPDFTNISQIGRNLLFFNDSTAIMGPGRFFNLLIYIHSRYDSLDEWSARRKIST